MTSDPSRPMTSDRKRAASLRPFSVQLPGIETDALPGNMTPDLPVRSRSVRFSTARYLRFRFQVLTASRPVQVFTTVEKGTSNAG
jgi:hypothetical protein